MKRPNGTKYKNLNTASIFVITRTSFYILTSIFYISEGSPLRGIKTQYSLHFVCVTPFGSPLFHFSFLILHLLLHFTFYILYFTFLRLFHSSFLIQHSSCQRSTTQVSLLPPPCDEFTTSDPSRSATLVNPPGTISIPDGPQSAYGRRST